MSGLDVLLILIVAGISVAALFLLASAMRTRGRLTAVSHQIGASSAARAPELAGELVRQASAARQCGLLELRLRQIMTACPVPALLVDSGLVIVELSDSAAEKLDQPRRNRGLLETMESNELEQSVREAMAEQRPRELTLRLFAGGRRPFRVNIVPYRSAEGAECLIFLRDLSESFQFGELRSQFAATVSHELRTPLAGIRALADSLQVEGITDEERRHFLQRIDEETRRLAQLIDDLLFLSSLETGIDTAGESDLAQVTSQAMDKLATQAARFSVRMINEVPEDIALPLPDRMAAIIITNLLENAVRYSGRGSEVRVSAERRPEELRVAVSDNGIGIDAEHLPHIFERFYRVDKSRSKRLGGTGLGLSIVKHVVQSAGGRIEARSREGFGTQIIFSIPRPRS